LFHPFFSPLRARRSGSGRERAIAEKLRSQIWYGLQSARDVSGVATRRRILRAREAERERLEPDEREGDDT
jgi:hypothetical protein